MAEETDQFDEFLATLDAIQLEGFNKHGFSTLVVAYKFDPFDGASGTDVTRVGFRGGRMFAIGAAHHASDWLMRTRALDTDETT